MRAGPHGPPAAGARPLAAPASHPTSRRPVTPRALPGRPGSQPPLQHLSSDAPSRPRPGEAARTKPALPGGTPRSPGCVPAPPGTAAPRGARPCPEGVRCHPGPGTKARGSGGSRPRSPLEVAHQAAARRGGHGGAAAPPPARARCAPAQTTRNGGAVRGAGPAPRAPLPGPGGEADRTIAPRGGRGVG